MTPIKCAVTTCANTGEPNGAGCNRKGPRVPVFICKECLGQAGPWNKRRKASGLSLRQAAKILGVLPTVLTDIEHGREPSRFLGEMMARLYRGDWPVSAAGEAR